MWSAVNTPEGQDAIQRDLDRLKPKCTQVNLTRFNKSKCKVLHLSQGNIHYKNKLRDENIECSSLEKDLGLPVNGKLDQPCALTVQKANHILG